MNAYDSRAIANLILDKAKIEHIEITNLALQKLIYFSHGLFLVRTKKPLVSGVFEAWKYGPVHPTVYKAFKDAGSFPITARACGKDVLTGNPRVLKVVNDPVVDELIVDVLRSFGKMSAGRLVDLSHAKNSPWDYIVDKSRTKVAIGLRIPDDVIIERFQYHKVTVDTVPRAGEPSDDTPIT